MKMRILFIGAVVFVIWSFFSAWFYVNNIKPAMNKLESVQPIPVTRNNLADSLMQLKALMPEDLIIYFEFDKAKFNPDAQTDNGIAEFKSWLEKDPASMLTITGNTDFIGTSEYNQVLGRERALIVQKYLESKGIAASRMKTDTEVKEQSVADKITSAGRAKNRSTVITIKK
jgi:OmpA-OmpF porin, OOP family